MTLGEGTGGAGLGTGGMGFGAGGAGLGTGGIGLGLGLGAGLGDEDGPGAVVLFSLVAGSPYPACKSSAAIPVRRMAIKIHRYFTFTVHPVSSVEDRMDVVIHP